MSACVEYTLSMEEFMSFTSCSRSTSSSVEVGGRRGGRGGEGWKKKVSDSDSRCPLGVAPPRYQCLEILF